MYTRYFFLGGDAAAPGLTWAGDRALLLLLLLALVGDIAAPALLLWLLCLFLLALNCRLSTANRSGPSQRMTRS